MARPTILITGPTGYVGGRLVRAIDRDRYRVRALVRNTAYVAGRFDSDIEVMRGDALEPSSLLEALQGVDTAFYLIHSLGSPGDYAEVDREAAKNFATAAKSCGVKRIIYLGGLGSTDDELSPHLSSRQEVGDVLREAGVPVIEFQASIVLGSGSISFEMIRALTEKLPVMITPKWVSVPAQPIAIEDLITYLTRALDRQPQGDEIYQIGGPDVVSYGDLMRAYAKVRGLRRWMIPVPFLTPKLSSLWLSLFTPIYKRIGSRLISSLRNPTVVTDDSAREVFAVTPRGVQEAIERALKHEDQEIDATRWSDALSSVNVRRDWGGIRFGNRVVDMRKAYTSATPQRVFEVIQTVGGERGWFYANWLWKLRGILDVIFGGVGMHRGRRNPTELSAGDVVDCWRVERVETDRLIRFIAEMKLPGRAWLEFEIEPEDFGTRIRQTAVFDPVGLFGLLYWYSLFPIHQIIFSGMVRRIGEAASNGPKRARVGGHVSMIP